MQQDTSSSVVPAKPDSSRSEGLARAQRLREKLERQLSNKHADAEQQEDTARNLLALGRDHLEHHEAVRAADALKLAVTAYEKLSDADAKRPELSLTLADAHHALGDAVRMKANAAEQAADHYRTSIAVLERKRSRRKRVTLLRRNTLAIVYEKLGDVQLSLNHKESALTAFARAERQVNSLRKIRPNSAILHRGLAVLLDKRGGVLQHTGRLDEAKQVYLEALRLRREFCLGDNEPLVLRELAISYDRLGDIARLQQAWDDALQAHRDALGVREKLAVAEDAPPELQRDLSISQEKLGDLYRELGSTEEALEAYKKVAQIRGGLAASHPKDRRTEADLAVIRCKLGDLFVDLENWDGALFAYRAGHDSFVKLAVDDWGNANRQVDLSVSHRKIGDVLRKLGDPAEALKEYRRALSIRERLVARDPSKRAWKQDLVVIQERIGDTQLRTGLASQAAQSFSAAFEAVQSIKTTDPDWNTTAAILCFKMWRVAVALEKPEQAEAIANQCIAFMEPHTSNDNGMPASLRTIQDQLASWRGAVT